MTSPDTFRLLRPEDFSFHGFAELMTSLAETLDEVGIRGGAPTVAAIENAVFVPAAKVHAIDRTAGRFVHEGGLVTSEGEPVEMSRSRRRGTRWGTRVLGEFSRPMAVNAERRVDEEVVYLGWYFDHFGHFLTESLARTWFLEKIDPDVKVLFHTKRNHPSGITRQILEAFGILPERILWLEEPTLLRRVIVPKPLYELSYSAHEWMPRPFRQVASQVVSGGQPSEQPVYLSRRLLPSHLRQIVGEFELEEVLRENGFLIAHLETMTFPNQVRLFNQHTDIFTSAGSAAYNVLFALHNPTLHFLMSDVPRADYFLAPAVAGASSAYCNCFEQGDRPSINTTPLLVEFPKLVDYLESRGFLRKRLRASLAGQGYGMRERFDEAWFYASVRDIPDGEVLAAEVEEEAQIVAQHSWPVSFMLARYYSCRNPSRVDGLARQFSGLVMKEADFSRWAQHHDDVQSSAARIVECCAPDTATRLTSLLRDRFLVDASSPRRRKQRRVTVPATAKPCR